MTKEQLMTEIEVEIEHLAAASKQNSAVAECSRAWTLAYARARMKNQSCTHAREQARVAYRLAMPTLVGEKAIPDFVACVTFGIAMKTIDSGEASKLLYAAQVATSASRAASQSNPRRSSIRPPKMTSLSCFRPLQSHKAAPRPTPSLPKISRKSPAGKR